MRRAWKWLLALGSLLALALGLRAWVAARSPGGDVAGASGAGARNDPALTLPALDPNLGRPKASLRGKVLDPAGAPAEGALVWAADALGKLHQAQSGTDGQFAFADLGPGEYRLAAQRGVETSESVGPLPLSAGDDLRDLLLKLAPGARLAGAVLDFRSRAALPGALIKVAATPLSAVADERGHFLLPPLPPGGHVLSVQAEGYLTRQVPLTARSGEDTRALEIYLTAASRVSGVVVTKDGTGVPALPAAAFALPGCRRGAAARRRAARPADDAGPLRRSSSQAGAGQLVARSPGSRRSARVRCST